MGRPIIPLDKRLLRFISVQSNGCWWWTGRLDKYGYGSIRLTGRTRQAHRVSYEFYKGPIPEGKQLDHQCHDPKECVGGNACPHRRCVNPDHLEPATVRENCSTDRTANGERSAAAIFQRSKTHCPQGHEYTPENTDIGKHGRFCLACRKIHNKNQSLARALRNRLAKCGSD